MTEMCHEVRGAIALEGRAPESEVFQKHVGECDECARFLESVRAVEDELGALGDADVADAVVDELLARPELASRGRSHKIQWAMGLAAAAMIAVVAARVTLMGRKDLARETELAEQNVPASPSGDDAVAEARERLDSLGYVGDDELRQRRDYQAVTGPSVRRELSPSEEELVAQQKLKESDQSASRPSTFRDADAAAPQSVDRPVESKNEALKKDAPAERAQSSTFATEGGRVNAPAAEPAEAFQETAVEEGAVVFLGTSRSEAATSEKTRVETQDFRSRVIEPDPTRLTGEIRREPKKVRHVDAVYPESAKRKRMTGEVVLRAVIDRDGNVTRAIVVESVEGLDQAAIDAVMQWKYEPADVDERNAVVHIAFEAPPAPNDDARLFLEERERVDGLRFREARGYWANTYLPGDPKARFLAMRLGKIDRAVAPHLSARPVAQPFDAPHRGALSVTLHADRRGIRERERLLVQVGVQATESHGRRRPPMNVGIVLDANGPAARAAIESLEQARALGDRFRLIVPGDGEVVAPEEFRHGSLAVALAELDGSGDLADAVRTAMTRVHAGDDPTMPLGSSLVLILTDRELDADVDNLARLAHRSAVGGVPVSVVGVGARVDREAIERLALSGHGRRYVLEQAADATSIVDRELAASSRVVARALRLRIKLAAGVKLVDVIGSHSLSERQAERVREAEKSIDLRLSRNLGIEADRGEDEDGIQIVIPSFYAGDAHTILLDVVAERPGAIAEVTARYKDLAELRNTVARSSLSLPRSDSAPGPLERNVLKNFFAHRLSEELEAAADDLESGDRRAAIGRLEAVRRTLAGLRLGSDGDVARDIAMLNEYIHAFSSSTHPVAYLADSLRLAGARKKRLPAGLT